MDYLTSVWIFLLVIAGVVCLVPNRRKNQSGWTLLGVTLLLAALLRGWPLIYCEQMMDVGILAPVLLMLVCAGSCSLYAARRISGNSLYRFLLLLPLLVGLFLCFTLLPENYLRFGRWLIWAPSLFLLAWAFYDHSKIKNNELRKGCLFLAWGLLLLAFLNPMPSVYDMDATTPDELSNLPLIKTHVLWVLLTTLACVSLLAGSWICYRQSRLANIGIDRGTRQRAVILCALLILLFGAGWPWAEYGSMQSDHDWRKDLTTDAEMAATAISPILIQQLSGTHADTVLPAYGELKARLARITKAGDAYHFSYLLGMNKKGQVVYLVDDEPSSPKVSVRPGEVYRDAEQELPAAFQHPSTFTAGPHHDQWGTRIDGFAPVPGVTINGRPVYLGLNQRVDHWNEELARQQEQRIAIVLGFGIFIVGLFALNHLISEARIRQKASEDRLRLSLHGANLASWELDIPTQTITVDQVSMKNHDGLELPGRLTAEEFLSLVHPEDRANARQAFLGFFQGVNTTLESEFRLGQSRGKFVWVMSRGQVVHRGDSGENLRAAGLILDISERKKTELELVRHREAAKRLALVAETTSNAVVIASPAGEIEWVNAGFLRITGYSLEEVRGKKPGRLLQGKDTDPKVVQRMRTAIAEGRGFQEIVLNYTKAGVPNWVEIECQALHDEQGRLSGFMAIKTDVTRRIKVEQALENQRHRLQQINATLLALRENYEENMMELTALAGKVFRADRALYSRIENENLQLLGTYGVSEGYPSSLPAAGSLYAEVILGQESFLSLAGSSLHVRTDPDLTEFQTYIGQRVVLSGEPVGALSVLFKGAVELSPDLRDSLSIIAQAIGREELLHQSRCRLDMLAKVEAAERSRFSTLLKNIDDAVLVEDPQHVITYSNPAFEKMFGVANPLVRGLSCSVVEQKTSSFFAHPERFLASIEEAREKSTVVLNQVFEMSDGRHLSRDFVPILNGGILYGYMWRYCNITRIKRHQLLLETVADVGQLVLNTSLNSPNAWLALVTLLGKKLGLDRVRVVRYKLSESEELREAQVFAEWERGSGRSVYHTAENVLTYHASEQPASWLASFLNGRSVHESGAEIIAPTLKEIGTKSFLCIPLTVEGRLWGTIGLHYSRHSYRWQDEEITLLETASSLISSRLDLQQSEKALLAAKNAADDASRAKSAFLATMSHEIRTPLNAVIGVSSLLLETKMEPQQRDYAATVVSSGEILLDLINDILDYSKIEAGRIEVEQSPFTLADVLIEPLEILARPAAAKNIELAYSADTTLPPVVVGDRARLKQVLLNLTSNAVKFTGSGTVTVRAEKGGDASRIRFIVRDTGIGMSEEVQQRLFEPFMQADSSITRKFGGTGLGLAISKRLIELMGGEISVASEPGAWTAFTFEIPLPAGKSETTVAPAQDASFLGSRVLIVDDNGVNRQFLHDQLGVWGMNTSEAEGGREVLKLLKAGHRFDLILLDYQMPDQDGISLARAIKAMPGYEKIPLILLSSIIERLPSEDAPLFSAALTKPLRAMQLMEVISNALGTRKSAKPAQEDLSMRHALIRVLVAEDNVTNQKVIKMMLSRFGVTPVIVENGFQAVEAVKSAPFDLVLIDIQMPVMDGIDATRLMRKHFGSGPRPEIIALTANAFKEDREACLAAGMDGYLVKPITLDRLRAVVEKVGARVTSGESIG